MIKREIMETIYALTGIEPKLWHDPMTDTFCSKKKTLIYARLINSDQDLQYNLEFPCPYYPLEQVLDHLGSVQGAYKEIGNSQECKHSVALRMWHYLLRGISYD